ncbi:hypothetical protein LshimejAT787_0806230 [Lyophyllum shimeji]|uniref:Uncharacterized protein n=1 Tax=Lyophyllum shimeji TaxID=47721 RepID=A0A9P3UPZ3_LYOSH|nr:hypothetical protein LshimejAT787_0806230 [Lyophyllum shimeji]
MCKQTSETVLTSASAPCPASGDKHCYLNHARVPRAAQANLVACLQLTRSNTCAATAWVGAGSKVAPTNEEVQVVPSTFTLFSSKISLSASTLALGTSREDPPRANLCGSYPHCCVEHLYFGYGVETEDALKKVTWLLEVATDASGL